MEVPRGLPSQRSSSICCSPESWNLTGFFFFFFNSQTAVAWICKGCAEYASPASQEPAQIRDDGCLAWKSCPHFSSPTAHFCSWRNWSRACLRTGPCSHSGHDGKHSRPEQSFAGIHSTPDVRSRAYRAIQTSVASLPEAPPQFQPASPSLLSKMEKISTEKFSIKWLTDKNTESYFYQT